jgi:hypothetical protein
MCVTHFCGGAEHLIYRPQHYFLRHHLRITSLGGGRLSQSADHFGKVGATRKHGV